MNLEFVWHLVLGSFVVLCLYVFVKGISSDNRRILELGLKGSWTDGYKGERDGVAIRLHNGGGNVRELLTDPAGVGGRSAWWLTVSMPVATQAGDRLIIVENVLTRPDAGLIQIPSPPGWGEFLRFYSNSVESSSRILRLLKPSPVHPRRWKRIEVGGGLLQLHNLCGAFLPSDREVSETVSDIRAVVADG